jgi:filamentous hemagglutinin family protein
VEYSQEIEKMTARWWRTGRVQLGLAGVVTAGAIAFDSIHTLAQVVADPTLGSVVTDTGGGVDTITGGATQNTNLFHSFDSFSVLTGRTAFFNNATNIQNILSRVTGSSISDIDGLIRANGAANLFLLNPNGIIFGQNARLNIGGSFIATTASRIDFADGTQFSATPGTGAPLLTVSVPLGLQFGASRGNIISRASGVGLQVQPGRTLGLIAGNVSLDDGNLTARGGRIELGAVASPAAIGLSADNSGFRFSFPTDLALGDISLINSSLVDTRAGGGGSIAVNARNLSLFGGSEIVSGIGTNQGTVGAVSGDIDINAQGAISIDGQNQRGFSSGFFNNVAEGSTGRGGNINVRTGSLSLTNRSSIAASTFAAGDAGNVNINARDGVSLDNGSRIFSQVNRAAIGNGGSINISGRSLSLTNNGVLTTNTFGQGNAGNIQVNTSDSVFASSNSFLGAASFSRGNSGNITITAGGLVSLDGDSGIINSLAPIPAFEGNRQGGDINIKARSLSVTNEGLVAATTLGQGNAGNIRVETTDDVTISGGSALQAISGARGNAGHITVASGGRVSLDGGFIFTAVGRTALFRGEGEGGDINIKARSLSLSNGAQIGASTQAQGNAGNIQMDITDSIDTKDGSIIQAISLGAGSAGNITITAGDRIAFDGVGANGVPSGVLNALGETSEPPASNRRGGDINIKARSLSVTNGALINSSTVGQGDAGNVTINVQDTATFAGVNRGFKSSVGSTVEAAGVGKGGDITLSAGTLWLRDGAQISAASLARGDAGNVTIDVRDRIVIDGVGPANPAAIGSSVEEEGTGKGGNVSIKTGSLLLKNGSLITAGNTGRQGDAGNVTITARDRIEIDGTGTIGERIIPSAVLSALGQTPQFQGNRQGGNITIKARSLSLSNGAQLNSSSLGQGNAGNIDVDVRSLNLDRGNIFAITASGDGGNIQLRASKSLRLRNNSQISTTAGTAQQPGDGGNITINSPLIIANSEGNNDITANAFSGRGGRVDITADSIIGLTPRSRQELQTLLGTDDPTQLDPSRLPSNDITAISQTNPSLGGTVSFNAADIDPSRDIVELPEGLVDASALVASGCPSGAENRFVVAGRGGLPPAPGDKLSTDALLTDWATLQTPETGSRVAVETTIPEAANTTSAPPVETITEATSWQFDRNGNTILTATPQASDRGHGTPATSCHGS